MSAARVRGMFLTHTHTDHILGGIWVVRAVGHAILAGEYQGDFCVWGHRELIGAFRQICMGGAGARYSRTAGRAHPAAGGIGRPDLRHSVRPDTFFDTGCALVRQFGCAIRAPDGARLAYLGDEPIHPQVYPYVQGCGWLIADALCLEAERQIHHPEHSFHSSVKETCQRAEELGVQRLILCHTEDTHGPLRKALYTREGRNTSMEPCLSRTTGRSFPFNDPPQMNPHRWL